MAKRERKAKHPVSGKWFAPPSGGYSGLGPDGKIVTRRGTPPKTPAPVRSWEQRRDEGTGDDS